jgi:copper chaperone
MTSEFLVQVRGMTCEGCEERIVSALKRLDGVRDADADHRRREVRVRFDPDRVTRLAVRERIEFAGYEVGDDIEAAR